MADKIETREVTSSNLARVGYDGPTQVLAVEFKNGIIVHYAGVEPDLAQLLFGAESKGAFYSAHVRGRFPGQRMTGPCDKCGANGWIGDACVDCGCGKYAEVVD